MAFDEGLLGGDRGRPSRGVGPTVVNGRPVLRTIYSEPAPTKFIERPGVGRIGPRPTAYQASGGYMGGSKYGSAMANLARQLLRANRLI